MQVWNDEAQNTAGLKDPFAFCEQGVRFNAIEVFEDMRCINGGKSVLPERQRLSQVVHDWTNIPLGALITGIDNPDSPQPSAKMRMIRKPCIPGPIQV